MIRIFRKRKFLVRIFLPIALFTYSAISFVVTRTPTISIASSNILYTNSNYSASFDVPFNNIERNFTDFWITVRARLTNDSLYPATFDDKQVITALRHGKIIYADLFKKQTSLKLMLKFEGSQTAIFKVKLLERDNKGEHQCNVGCERPEYEIVAYTLNRMFDLRNMPYTAGRNLSWSSDLEPVASPALKTFVQVEEDFSVCFNWSCLGRPSTRYCFKNGEIPGAVIYFIEDANIRFIKSSKNFYHGYHLLAAEKKDLQRLPGDKRFCKNFRLDLPYTMDAWFLDIIDIAVLDYLMSHLDAKHTYISEGHNFSEPEFNVMFDFGHAFCHIGDKLLILAPLIQCCRIRTRLFKAMDKYRDTLEETFISLTKDDALHPLLTPELMSDLNHRFKQTLALTDFCRNLEGDSVFFIDL